MIKPFIIFINTIGVFLFSFLMGDLPVTISGNFPKSVAASTEFTAEIKINKANIGGFAKLQLEVPDGFTVKEIDSKTGNFSFTGNIAKIIWTAMPTESEFSVKFAITADASVNGVKTIASKFSFVNNNVKEVVEMTPAEVTVGNSSSGEAIVTTTTQSVLDSVPAIVDAANTSQPTPSFENLNEPNSTIICSRVFSEGSSANEVNVEVKIKKGSIKGFAKFQEALPAGFNAKSVKTNGSSFSVSDGKIKFVWVSLPADEELVVSYILEKTSQLSEEVKLDNGEFSYLENEQSKKTKLPVDVIEFKASTEITKNDSTEKKAEAVSTETSVTTEPAKTETVATTAESIKTETKEVVAKKEGNVNYNVQIGAFKNAIKSDVLSKMFKITETIKSEMAEGLNKFMVGNFSEYKEARSHREVIKQKGCSTAFVVAYNGAKRITVQEALMITNQKWFK